MGLKLLGLLVMALIIVIPIALAAWYAWWSVPNDGDYSGPAPRMASCLVSAPMKLVMLFIIPGMLAGVIGVTRIVNTLESRDWPTAEGTVYATSIQEHPGMITTYSLNIEYRFQAEEMSYTGFNVTGYDFRVLDRADLEGQLAKYPKGTVVTVHYNPDGPYNSVLETRFGPGIPFIVGLSTSLLVISTVATGLFLRANRLVHKHAQQALLSNPSMMGRFY